MTAKFRLGAVAATPAALTVVAAAGQSPVEFLVRHVRGDWGDVDAHDYEQNEAALRGGDRLQSSYRTRGGEVVWVITEADRSSTSILLPEDY